MKIEIMIYVYIAICISMIAFNIVYVFVLRHREKALGTNSQKLKKIIYDQIEIIKNDKEISEKHIKYLCKKLDRTAGITAFDRALESVFEKGSGQAERERRRRFYLENGFSPMNVCASVFGVEILGKNYSVFSACGDGKCSQKEAEYQ